MLRTKFRKKGNYNGQHTAPSIGGNICTIFTITIPTKEVTFITFPVQEAHVDQY